MTEKLYNAKRIDYKTIELDSGNIIQNFHDSEKCLGDFCPVHNPSAHALRSFPLDFNGVHMVRRLSETEITIDPDDYYFNQHFYAILRNSAKCLECGDEIESRYRHNYKSCSCGNVFVDGGFDYIRQGAKDMAKYANTSIEMKKDSN